MVMAGMLYFLITMISHVRSIGSIDNSSLLGSVYKIQFSIVVELISPTVMIVESVPNVAWFNSFRYVWVIGLSVY